VGGDAGSGVLVKDSHVQPLVAAAAHLQPKRHKSAFGQLPLKFKADAP
jgi:hypothetical protein